MTVIYSDGNGIYGDVVISECADCLGTVYYEVDTYHDPTCQVERSYNNLTLDELKEMARAILDFVEEKEGQ